MEECQSPLVHLKRIGPLVKTYQPNVRKHCWNNFLQLLSLQQNTHTHTHTHSLTHSNTPRPMPRETAKRKTMGNEMMIETLEAMSKKADKTPAESFQVIHQNSTTHSSRVRKENRRFWNAGQLPRIFFKNPGSFVGGPPETSMGHFTSSNLQSNG